MSAKKSDRMDGEIIIDGFTAKSIKKCGAQYLESQEKYKVMLKQAVKYWHLCAFESADTSSDSLCTVF